MRRWDAAGSRWLVRIKDNPKVDDAGKPMACKAVAAGLAFSKTRQVQYHGKTYWQWVAETEVTLSRPAKPSHLCPVGKRKANNPLSPAVPAVPAVLGVPVQARRVLSQVMNDGGDVLAHFGAGLVPVGRLHRLSGCRRRYPTAASLPLIPTDHSFSNW